MRILPCLGLLGGFSLVPLACGGGVTQPAGAGDDAGSDDAANDSAPPVDAGAPGTPMTAPNEQWTWFDFPDAKCMNGSPTGLGINVTNRSDKLVIFLMGGGACWDFITVTAGTCANMNGYDKAHAESDFTKYGSVGLFDRTDADNPFKDYSFVFVPYCSGDVFSGDNEKASDGKMHVGYRNVTAYLTRIVPTWPHPSQLFLTGSSAGGMGTLMNIEQMAQAWPSGQPIVALDDAAVVMSPQYLKPGLQQSTDDAWHYSQHFPSDCPDLKVGALHEVYACIAKKLPNLRLGLYATQGDSTMRGFFGYGYNPPGQMPAADYAAGLVDISTNLIAPFPEIHNYWAPGTSHTFLGQTPLGQTVVNGVKITDWLRGLRDGTSAFVDVAP